MIDLDLGHLFPPLDRNKQRPIRTRVKNKQTEILSAASFFQFIEESFQKDLSKLYNTIRITLNKLSRKLLRQIAAEILEPENFVIDRNKEQCYLYILDIIDTKFSSKLMNPHPVRKTTPKNVCIVHFVNKGMDDLHLSSIFKSNEINNILPKKIRRG